MIFRLSQKLAAKIKVRLGESLPPDPNPLADWSGHVFTYRRVQYVILTNTPSLYSTIMPGKGISTARVFLDRSLECIREFLRFDGQESAYHRRIEPAIGDVRFSSSLNRSVIGSVNDMVKIARFWLDDGFSPFDVAYRLNDMPMSSLEYADPQAAFKALLRE